jgi:hypothetical protein
MLGQYDMAHRFEHFHDCLCRGNGRAVACHGESKVDFHIELYRLTGALRQLLAVMPRVQLLKLCIVVD